MTPLFPWDAHEKGGKLIIEAMTKVPSTSPHKLSAERVAKVTKKLLKRLVQKGVLPPPREGVLPQPQPRPLKPER